MLRRDAIRDTLSTSVWWILLAALLVFFGTVPAAGQVSKRQFHPRQYDAADLSDADCIAATVGYVYGVYNAADETDCTVGSGTHTHPCVCDEASLTWVALSSFGSGAPACSNNDSVRSDGTNLECYDGLQLESGAATSSLYVEADGDVGLGTSVPAADLHIQRSGTNTVAIGSTTSGGTSSIELGFAGTGNRFSFVDLTGDATYTDYGLRLIRSSGGANTNSGLYHRGLGELQLEATDAGDVVIRTSATDRMTVEDDGDVGIGTKTPSRQLSLYRDDAGVINDPSLLLEQDGTGDVGLQLGLTGVRNWVIGIDNSDGDALKVQPSLDAGFAGVVFQIATGGGVTVPSLSSCDTIDTNAAGLMSCGSDANTQRTDEEITDLAGGMVSGNTETGIAVTFQDADNTLDFVAEVTQSEFDGKTLPTSGLTTNRIVKTSGTTGDIQQSGITIDASNNIDAGLNNLEAGGKITSDDYRFETAPPGIVGGNSMCTLNGGGEDAFGECTSSARFKTGIVDATVGLAEALRLRPRRFHWTLPAEEGLRAVATSEALGRPDLGLVAEEAAEVDPRLATFDAEGRPAGIDERAMIALLVAAVQDLSSRLDAICSAASDLDPSGTMADACQMAVR